jgi:hypothetical protein
MTGKKKRIIKIAAVFVAIAAILLSIGLVFGLSGNVKTTINQQTKVIRVESSYIDKATKNSNSFTISKDSYLSLKYDFKEGIMLDGGTLGRIRFGFFDSDDYGKYSLNIYKSVKCVIVAESENGTFYVFNDSTEKSTKELFEKIEAIRIA